MQTRRLGNTDLSFTTIGLGTWAMGGEGWRYSWGPQDDQLSKEAIHQALNLGVNWIETAAVYGLGHAEEVLAKALQGITSRPYIATKCGRHSRPNGALYGSLRVESIRKEVEASLSRLQIDAIDLYQIHWPDPDDQIEEGWSAMAGLVKEGKIRYAGVSNFNLAQLKRIHPIHPVASLQPPYSMLRRDLEGELLEYCSQNNIGVVVYSPMSKGLLTDKITHDWVQSLPQTDHRTRDSNFQEPRLSIHLSLLDGLKEISARHGRSIAQLAIAWTLRQSAVTSAIVGARHPEQIRETAYSGDWTLPEVDVASINQLLQKHTRALSQL